MEDGRGTMKRGTLSSRQATSQAKRAPISTPAGSSTGRARRSSAASTSRVLAAREDQAADLLGGLAEARVELHVRGARAGQADLEHAGEAAGARGHHDHAIR